MSEEYAVYTSERFLGLRFAHRCLCICKRSLRMHRWSPTRICLLRRHFWTVCGTTKKKTKKMQSAVVRFWGPKNRPCLWGKETQRFFGLRFVRISNCSQKRICLARRHFWTLRWTALIFLGVLLCAFGGQKIVPASGRRKRSVFWGFVWCAVHAKVTII